MTANCIITAAACFFLVVDAGLAAPPVTRVLPSQTGTITGHVRDTSGKPLAHIPVEVMQTGEFAVTDEAGAYTLAQEEPAAYTLTAKGGVTPTVTKRTQVTIYSQGVVSITLLPAGHIISDLILKPLGAQWVSPHSSPILQEYSGPEKAGQLSQVDALKGGVFGGDVGLHSTARSR